MARSPVDPVRGGTVGANIAGENTGDEHEWLIAEVETPVSVPAPHPDRTAEPTVERGSAADAMTVANVDAAEDGPAAAAEGAAGPDAGDAGADGGAAGAGASNDRATVGGDGRDASSDEEGPDDATPAGDEDTDAAGDGPGEDAVAVPAEAGTEDDADTDGAGETEGETEGEAARAAEKEAEVAELCRLMTTAADRYGVPHDFFIRLIWKESRFNPNAVSPVGAQGIAQFMPGTARLRGLKNPFDREEALNASAHFLSDLKARFGSWGLAAAGYNGGPNRVPPFVAGRGGLPYETIDYVYSITGRTAQHWALRERARRGVITSRPNPAVLAGFGPMPYAHLALKPLELGLALITPEDGEADGAAPAEAIGEDAAPDVEDGDVAIDEAAVDAVSAEGGTVEDVALRIAPAVDGEDGPVADAEGEAAAASPPLAPRPRPFYEPARVDCPKLVASLGLSRSVSPPMGGDTGWTPWGAQVAGHPQRNVAMRQYARVKARLPGDLVSEGPRVVVRRFAARGRRPIHAVMFAAASRGEAEAKCRRVSSALVPCVVVRNR